MLCLICLVVTSADLTSRGRFMKRTSILLADDHAMLLSGLVHLLSRDFDVVGAAYDGGALVEMVKQHRPDVVVTDIAMPHLNGIEAVRLFRQEAASAKI